MCPTMLGSDQFVAAIQVEYNASGTTMLYPPLASRNASVSESAGTAVACEKSTSSSDEQPSKA